MHKVSFRPLLFVHCSRVSTDTVSGREDPHQTAWMYRLSWASPVHMSHDTLTGNSPYTVPTSTLSMGSSCCNSCSRTDWYSFSYFFNFRELTFKPTAVCMSSLVASSVRNLFGNWTRKYFRTPSKSRASKSFLETCERKKRIYLNFHHV